jgi:membrane carboxypeptidase/penicillin-binding protein
MRTPRQRFQILSQRRKRKKKIARSFFGKSKALLISSTAIVLSAFFVGLLIFSIAFSVLTHNMPAIDILPLLLSPNGNLRTPTKIFDRSGKEVLYQFSGPQVENARYISLEIMPAYIIYATLTASDDAYYQHKGYNLEDIPTIETRLVNDFLLWDEPDGFAKKLRSKILASQIHQQFGKEKILEWFINSANYGNFIFGIDQAAWAYFNKSAEHLSLAEAALIAPLANTPELNPITSPTISLENQNVVLSRMVDAGFISFQQASDANKKPLQIDTASFTSNEISSFINLLISQISEEFPLEYFSHGGMEIVSTQNYSFQSELECVTLIQLQNLNQANLDNQTINKDCDASRFLPTLPRAEQNAYQNLESATVMLNPKNGQVLAMVGDSTTPHTPGTSLSPYVYLSAFARGLSPATLTWDTPNNVLPSMEAYGNFDSKFHGPIPLRIALANDYIIPTLNVIDQIGATNIWQTAKQSGLYSLEIPEGLNGYKLVLDEGNFSLLDISHAYSLFSNGGVLAGYSSEISPENLSPTTVISMKDVEGRIYIDWGKAESNSVVSPQLSYLITDILGDNLARQESLGNNNPLETGLFSAGKIGQTFDGLNSWTFGYSSEIMIGVWMGYSENYDLSNRAISPVASAGLWHATIKYSHIDIPNKAWRIPVGITELKVCVPSGMLPSSLCPLIKEEIFLSGNEPYQIDNLYKSLLVNQQTNKLATIYTPPEFITEETFLIVPPEYTSWAIDAGYELPPTQYDVVFSSNNLNPNVEITSPKDFQYLSGNVNIVGSALGDGFSFYRIQIGNGLNPRQWLQVGEIEETPVAEGSLANWDTNGLNGLFAIQLQVVDQNQSIQTDTIQVTLDNINPTVEIQFPIDGQYISYPTESNLTIQTNIIDNIGIDHVNFYLNNQLISSLNNAPYTSLWLGEIGTYTLKIIATDLAGNIGETALDFEIGN